MITRTEIRKGINKLLVQKFPNRPVYLDNVPQDFKRPSFLLNAVKSTPKSANCCLLKDKAYFTITIYTELNEYGDMDNTEQLEAQDEVLSLFRSSKLPVGDRMLEVNASGGGMNSGEAYIDVQVEYYDLKTEDNTHNPLMADITTNLKINQGG